jgi:hypothetical protein
MWIFSLLLIVSLSLTGKIDVTFSHVVTCTIFFFFFGHVYIRRGGEFELVIYALLGRVIAN